MTNPTLDTSVAERRYVLVDTATDELGNDEFMTPDEAERFNALLVNQGSSWRWLPWAEENEAA